MIGLPAALGLIFAIWAVSRARTRRPMIWAVVWFVVALVELAFENGIGCDADCNIRPELLLIPLIVVFSLVRTYGIEARAGDEEARQQVG